MAVTGTVNVSIEYCKGCGLCVDACNRGVLAMGRTINNAGYAVVELAAPEKCNGCTLCAVMCPEVALEVRRRG